VKAANNPEAMAAMYTNAHSEPVLWGESSVPHPAISSSSVGAEAVLKFGRFRLLSRRRRLLAEGVPVELGSRAFDLLLILLEADGTLVTKKELLNRVWPNVVVSEENLKVQISALRKALGADRNLIVRNSGSATGSLAYCARTPPQTPAEAPSEESGGFLELCFGATADNRSSVVSVRASS
jgi:hypothetical protein